MINSDGDRRSFLRATVGRLAQEVADRTQDRVAPMRPLRPPGALGEMEFLAACTRCGQCIDVCPVRCIVNAPPGAGLAAGTPMIDPLIRACIACADMPCAKTCPTGALVPPPNLWENYQMATLELLPERCIAFQGVACGACARSCPVGERAIYMDGYGRPVIKAEGCVGCGSCVKACVTSPPSLTLHVIGDR